MSDFGDRSECSNPQMSLKERQIPCNIIMNGGKTTIINKSSDIKVIDYCTVELTEIVLNMLITRDKKQRNVSQCRQKREHQGAHSHLLGTVNKYNNRSSNIKHDVNPYCSVDRQVVVIA